MSLDLPDGTRIPPDLPRLTLDDLLGPTSPLTPEQKRRALALVLARTLMPNASAPVLRRTAAYVAAGMLS